MTPGRAARLALPLCLGVMAAGAAEFTLLGGRADCAAECPPPETARQVALAPAAIDRALAAGPWAGSQPHLATLLGMVLRHLGERLGALPIAASAFTQEFSTLCLSRSGADVTHLVARLGKGGYLRQYPDDPVILIGDELQRQMSEAGWAALVDLLEVIGPYPAVPSWQEAVGGWRRTQPPELRPQVVLITAGAAEALGAAHAGLRALAAYGAAIEPLWWPVDRVLQAALQSGDCRSLAAQRAALTGRYNREVLYPAAAAAQAVACGDPARLAAIIAGADLIVIDDGAAEHFAQALGLGQTPLPEWSLALRQAIAAGTPVLAAGAGAEILGREYAVGVVEQQAPAAAGEIRCAIPGCGAWHLRPGLEAVELALILTRAAEQGREWVLLDAKSRGLNGIGAALDAGAVLYGRATGRDNGWQSGDRLQAGGDGAVLLADYHQATWESSADTAVLERLALVRLTAGAAAMIEPGAGPGQASLNDEIERPVSTAAGREISPGGDLGVPGHFRAWLQALLLHRFPQGELEVTRKGLRYRLTLRQTPSAVKGIGENGLIAAGGIHFESRVERETTRAH